MPLAAVLVPFFSVSLTLPPQTAALLAPAGILTLPVKR